MSARPKIYLAGPDVFLPNAVDMGIRKTALCVEHGFDGLFPLDNEMASDTNEQVDRLIYRACVAMIHAADCGIFNLTPFRGPSADPGTVFELGLMTALGKPAFAYTNDPDDLLARMKRDHAPTFDAATSTWRDRDGMSVEDFGNVDNLMIDACLAEQQRAIVRHHARPENYFTDLEGFVACLQQARTHFFEVDNKTAGSVG